MIIDRTLVSAVEAAIIAERTAFADGMAQRCPSSGAGWLDVAGGRALCTGPELFSNRALGLALDGPVHSHDPVCEIERFYAQRGLPAEIEVASFTHRSLLEVLSRRGYWMMRFRNIYARRLADPVGDRNVTIDVRQIGAQQRAEWSDVLLDGFGYDAAVDRGRVAGWNEMVATRPGVSAFIASINGVPVGGASVMALGEVAVLGGAATRSMHRRIGVQTALIQARLASARRAGCSLAVVTADPGGSSGRNAERAGFTLVCNHLTLRAAH